jgi:hypothetical protein
MILVCFAAYHSAHNDVEHFWSPNSNSMTGVTLPRTLPGEDKPPSDQTSLSEAEKEAKEKVVFDEAIRIMFTYMSQVKFDGYATTCKGIPCEATECDPQYHDNKEIEEFLAAGVKKLADENNLTLRATRMEFLDLVRHVVRRTNQLEFFKCDDPACTPCSKEPIREESRPAFAFLKKFGGRLPTPTPDVFSGNGHYLTFLDHLHLPASTVLKIDQGLPSLKGQSDDETRCKRGCNWVFTSKTEREKHEILVHPTARKADMDHARSVQSTTVPTADAVFICKHDVDGKSCGLQFSTKYFLTKHKDEKGHTNKRKKVAE